MGDRRCGGQTSERDLHRRSVSFPSAPTARACAGWWVFRQVVRMTLVGGAIGIAAALAIGSAAHAESGVLHHSIWPLRCALLPRARLRAPHALPCSTFILAGVFGGLSLWVFVWFSGLASQSGAMFVPSALLIPLAAVVGTCVAVLWLASGLAVHFNVAWAKNVRTAAIVTSILFALALAPLVVGLAKFAVSEWLRRL